jgi:hypothetical protein
MELTFEQIRKYWEVRHPSQRITAREKVAVCCAFHGEDNPSCTLYLDGNGGFNCHACGAKGNLFQFEVRFSQCTFAQAEINVAAITGAKSSPSLGNLGSPVAFYDYRDENGIVLYQKRRYQPKDFRIYVPTPKGFVSSHDSSTQRHVLFNLPDLVKSNVVFLCEGEKDAINLGSAGLFSGQGFLISCTCAVTSSSWLESYNHCFSGKEVFIFADNDEPGCRSAEKAAAGIKPFAYRVRIIYFPELPAKGDVSDYLESHTPAELEAKIKATPIWTGQSNDRQDWTVELVEWTESKPPEIDWLIEGIIQRDGNGIIAAEPKTGKSLCSLDLLLSLAGGMRWLGNRVPRRTRCAYISREDSPALTRVRAAMLLRGKGVDEDLTGWIRCNTREQLGDFNVDNDEHLKNMAEDLRRHGVEFTIIDVLNRVHTRAENDNTEMAQVVGRISQMGRDAGCSIGLVHHVSKENNSGRFFTRIRGASAIHGWTEWSIGLSLGEKNAEGHLIRTAEFETKAGEAIGPISFVIDSKGGNLRLQPADLYVPSGTKSSWQDRYQ